MHNKKIRNTVMSIRREFACIPRDARCVIESSSVWYEAFRFIRDDLGYDVILSNPAQTKAIAASKKKTGKVDAHILTDLLRGIHRRITLAGQGDHRVKTDGKIQTR